MIPSLFDIERGTCQLKKKQDGEYFFRLIDFGFLVNIKKLFMVQLFMDDLLSNELHEKVMMCLLKEG